MQLDNPPSFGLREHLATIFRHKGKIGAVLFFSVAAALVGSFAVSKVYETHSRILIRHSRPPLQIDALMTRSTIVQGPSPRDDIRTEVEIFRSPVLVHRLVRELGADTILKKMRWRWDWLREIPRNLRDSASDALASMEWGRSLLGAESDPTQTGIGTEAQLAAEKIFDHLSAEPVRQADVFAVSFEAPSSVFAALVLNRIVELYIEHHLVLRQGTSAKQFYSEEADRLRRQLQGAEIRLQAFKSESGIVDPAAQKGLLLQRLSEAEANLSRAQLEAIEVERRIEVTRRQLSEQAQAIPLSSVSDRNPLLDELQNRLMQIELERKQYVADSPAAQQLAAEIADVQARIKLEGKKVTGAQTSGINQTRQELAKTLAVQEGRRKALESRLVLAEQVEAYRQALKKLDGEQSRFEGFSREVGLKEEALRLYMKKAEESRINDLLDSKKITNARVIEPAIEPWRPVRPKKLRNLILGILVGLLGGLGLAYISEYFRRTFANKDEVHYRLGEPVLASFPLSRSSGSKLEMSRQRSQLLETLRRAKRQSELRVVLITSSIEGEGRTSVSKFLARALAAERHRVLLLVVDESKHDAEPVTNPATNDAESAASLIKSTAQPNLYQLTVTLRANRLERYRTLADELPQISQAFEFVIIDGPALGIKPEGICVADAADGTIVVIQADRTTGESVAEMLRMLHDANAQILGTVLNKRRFVIPGWAYHWFFTPRGGKMYG